MFHKLKHNNRIQSFFEVFFICCYFSIIEYMSNNQLKYIVLAGLFAIPFVPLMVTPSLFFPFITGKAFIFRILVEIILACYLILAVRDENYRPKFSWILCAFATFLLVMAVADFFGQNSFKAFWSNYERMEGYITLLHLGAYFLVMGSVLKTQSVWNKLLATSVGASAIMAIYSFFQLAGKITINQGGVRIDGTLGNAGYLGIYMVFHIFFASLLFMRAKKNWHRVLLCFSVLLNTIILYFTATRGAILGLLGGTFLTLIFLSLKSEKGAGVKKFAIGALIGLLALVGIFLAVKNTEYVRNNYVLSRFASLSSSEFQTQGRYYVWPMAIKGIIEKPILGWGQEGFNFVFNKYYDPRMYGQEPWFDRAHSTPLDWLIAGGLLGFLSYVAIFLALFFYIFKSRDDSLSKEEKAIMLGLISAYIFNNLFVFDQIASYILFMIVIAYAHVHAAEDSLPLWNKISLKLKNMLEKIGDKRSVIEALTLVILILILYFANYLPWRQNKDLLNVLALANAGQVTTIDAYAKPLNDGGMGFSESLEHVSQTAMNLAANLNVPADLKDDLFKELDQDFTKFVERVPNDARYRLFYGIFLSRFGWYGRAVEQLKEAQKLSPDKQGIAFELASNLLLDGKIQEALEVTRHAYEVEPNYEEAKVVYGLVALASGDTTLSSQILADVPESRIIFDDRYITVLLSVGRYQDIVNVAKKRIELDPTNLQHRITLTAAYLQAGRREEAVQAIQEIIQLDSTFKEKGEYYISEIRAGRNP